MYLLYRMIGLRLCTSFLPDWSHRMYFGNVLQLHAWSVRCGLLFFRITHFVQQPTPVAWNVFRCIQTLYVISCAILISVVGMHVSYERLSRTGQARVTVENAVGRLYSGLEGCPWLEMFFMLTRVEAGSLALALEISSSRLQNTRLSRLELEFTCRKSSSFHSAPLSSYWPP